MKTKLALIVFAVNCAAALCVWGCMYVFITLDERMHDAYNTEEPARDGKSGVKKDSPDDLRIDSNMLTDKNKFNSTLESLKKKYRRITTAESLAYLQVPEAVFFRSLIDYFFLSHVLSGTEVVLDDAAVKDFLKQGILVYSMDKKYPFMKRSIYLDKRHKTSNKPTIAAGTNIIIIFVESLSQFFLREDVHGVKGLTPNIKDMEKHSLSFTDMHNSAFPTVKGLIAALGSSIYLLDESIGGTRIPIPCRFLFLSNILKSLDYTAVHIQAGSERFIGMKDFFIQREGYDQFYGSESFILNNIGNLSKGFGVDDSSVFNYTVDWLEKYSAKKPFLLTISTINMHPPFKVTDRNPNAGNSDLLDSLYSTDKSFGKFWEYFKKSKYCNNTMVILTADHAMGNNKDYLAFIKDYGNYARPFFDRIPCFMYLPGGAWAGRSNNVNCVNLDILPTILDMMNKDLANPFMGLTIFSERNYIANRQADGYRSKKSVSEIKAVYDEKQIEKAKKILSFYLHLYRENRILPDGYKVKFE